MSDVANLTWIRVTLPSACFAMAVDSDGNIVAGAPYGVVVCRKHGIKKRVTLQKWARSRRGSTVELPL